MASSDVIGRSRMAPLLAATRQLQLSARKLVSGLAAGIHASRRAGAGWEFSQFRGYQPGDEPRQIDWKLYARSDRFYIRESDVETQVPIRIILDATESMRHRAPDAAARPKFLAAQELAAALAYVGRAQGDPISLLAVQADRVRVLPFNARQPVSRYIHFLAQLEPAGSWPVARNAFAAAWKSSAPAAAGSQVTAEITVVLTDGHEHAGEIRAALAPLRTRRSEVVWIHLLTRDEVDFPFTGWVRFQEWETGRTLEADAGQVRDAYLADHANELAAWRRAWGGERFEYIRVITDEPLGPALRAYLRRRIQSGRGSR